MSPARRPGARMGTSVYDGHPLPGPRYVYGIVPSTAPVPARLRGVGDPAGRVSLVAHRRIAAVTSGVQRGQPMGTPADLRAHANVLNTLVTSAPVLPMRFGGVVADQEAVVAELLARHYDTFTGRLDRLDGHEQFTIKGRYVGDIALREVLAADPEAMRLREFLRGRAGGIWRPESIRLGELVARALDRTKLANTDALIDALAPHSAAIAEHATSAPDSAVQAAFLVRQPRRPGFERAAEELGRRWHGRIRLRLVGPIAPFDFAEPPEGDEPWACLPVCLRFPLPRCAASSG